MNTELNNLIQAGRERFAADLSETGQSFDALTWDISSLARQLTRARHVYVHFVRYPNAREPLPPVYAHVLKSVLLLTRAASAEALRDRLLSARILCEVLLTRHARLSDTYDWTALSAQDLEATEHFMRQRWSDATTHKSMLTLLRWVGFLSAHGVCPPVSYTPYTPRQRDLNTHTLEGQDQRRAKLPTPRTLEGLADSYADRTLESPDRLRLAATALLVATGMRIGELLTLPLDCEIADIQRGHRVYGLRYHKEKAGHGEHIQTVRWLSAAQGELAQAAVAEIRLLTEPARERARILEQSPDRVRIPQHDADDWLTVRQLAALFGFTSHSGLPKMLQGLPYRTDSHKHLFRVRDVEAFLLKWRVSPLWTRRLGPNSVQMLSQTLLLAFRNYFHATHAPWTLLVEPFTTQTMNSFLCGKLSTKSIFQRMDIREQNGQFCRVTTHQFRHWLNDLADKGGMPVEALTRWMGRTHAQDTQDYRHATVDERLAWLKESIRTGKVTGYMADVYRELPAAERDVFLDGQIQAVHVTPLGFCIHDFAVEPCPYHLNCLRGCAHYLRTKGNQKEREHLIRVQDITVTALAHAREQMTGDSPALSPAWVRHHEDTLRGVERALAVDTMDVPDGTLVAAQKADEHG
jgi:hypothetical protein